MVRSAAYARARLVSGALFALLGAVVAYRTVAVAGSVAAAIPGCVLGAAMFALGAFRFRDYFAARRGR